MIAGTVDASNVLANIKNLQKSFDRSRMRRILDLGFEILRLSQKEVPHDKGTLQNSGTVEELNGDVIVAYHTRYAARLHEHPEYRFQKGRKGKYLEDPIKRNENILGIKLGRDIQKDVMR